jgi:AcrR family transcriptional regulator
MLTMSTSIGENMAIKTTGRGEKAYHRQDLKQELLDTALLLLREKGIKGFSLRELASRAGVSHTAPYRHFAGKDALLAELMLEGHRRLASALNAARQEVPGSAAERLLALGKAYMDFAKENPEHLSIMFSALGMSAAFALAHPPSVAGSSEYDSFSPLEATVRECQAEGNLDPRQSAEALAMAIWAQVHGLSLLRNEGIIGAMSRMRGGDERLTLEAIFGIIAAQYGKPGR